MKRLTWLGLILTATWIAAFAWIVWGRLPQAFGMSLNEWGDFLAGFSAPLALLWLVIGYFQQGKELALNTEALIAQQEELRQQVEQTRVLAENAARHADAAEDLAKLSEVDQAKEAERISTEAQPVFVPEGGSSGGAQSKTTITNYGAEVVRVCLEYDGAYDLSLADRPSLKKGDQITLVLKTDRPIDYPILFGIRYEDRYGEDHVIKFNHFGGNRIEELRD